MTFPVSNRLTRNALTEITLKALHLIDLTSL